MASSMPATALEQEPPPVPASGRRISDPVPAASPAILRSSFWLLSARGMTIAARGVALILVSRHLGSEQFGVYALLMATFNIVSTLASFGIEPTNLLMAAKDPRRIPTMLGNSILLSCGLGAAGALLVLASVTLLHGWIFAHAPDSAVMLTALGLPGAILQSALVGIVMGLGLFRYYGISESLKWCVYLLVLSWLHRLNRLDVASALACLYVVFFAGAILHLIVLTWKCRSRPGRNGRMMLGTLRSGRAMLAVHLGQVASLRLDLFAVRLTASDAALGQYALASRLSEIVLYGARAVGTVVFARTARSGRHVPWGSRLRLYWPVVILLTAGMLWLMAQPWTLRVLLGSTADGLVAILALRLAGVLALATVLVHSAELLGRGRAVVVVRGNIVGLVTLVACMAPLAAWRTPLLAAASFSVAATIQALWLGSRVRTDRSSTRVPAGYVDANLPPTWWG